MSKPKPWKNLKDAEDLDLWRESRGRFEQFAGMGGDQLPEDAIDAMQVKLLRWQRRNFDEASDLMQAAGVSEEMSELMEAVEDGNAAEVEDAFGDTMIYAGQLLAANRMAMQPLLLGAGPAAPLPRFVGGREQILTGRLQHVALKRAQGIRGLGDAEDYRRAIFATLLEIVRIAHRRAAAFADCPPGGRLSIQFSTYCKVGARVSARNWRADPLAGGEVAL